MRIRHKLLLLMLLAGSVGAFVVAAGAVLLLRQAVVGRSLDHQAAEATVLAGAVADLPPGRDLQDFAVRFDSQSGARVTLIDGAGAVLADSAVDRSDVVRMDNHLDRPEIRAARTRGFGQSIRRSASTNVEYCYSATLVTGDGPVRYARLSRSATDLRRLDRRFVLWIVGIVPLALLLLVLLTYASVRRLSRPIETIAESLERSAGGEFQLPLALPAHGEDEIGRLISTMRSMHRALLDRLGELGAERALFSSVIAGMREGLLLVDGNRQVRLANDAVRTILDLKFDPVGHRLEEVVRLPAVVAAIDAARSSDEAVEESVVRLPGSERSFELHVTPLRGPSSGDVIVLFFDITRLELLERVRRDFVANVSHELRTPLTSIKAFVENLLDGGLEDTANSRRFLEIVQRHSDRMGSLIEDITDLSLIETGAVSLDRRPVDVRGVIAEVSEPLRPLAAAAGVSLHVDLPAAFPLTADRRRLEQMLTNLLENAIKFNREGGSVTVTGEVDGQSVRLIVTDTGVGIPAGSLDKVFQRFYRVDVHRSRQVGGTGLGLSIVKHLMRLHGGHVWVESDLGRGSRFTLEFPNVDLGEGLPRIASLA